jgi:hypothetical protein
MVVLVRIETANCILFLEAFVVEHVKDLLLIGDLVIANYQTFVHADWLMDLKPRMLSNLFNLQSLFRVCVQNLLQKVRGMLAYKTGDLELSLEDLFVKL